MEGSSYSLLLPFDIQKCSNYAASSLFAPALKRIDMTQAELAQKSGIRQSNISRIENGNAIPRLDTLEALALAMGKKVKISIL